MTDLVKRLRSVTTRVKEFLPGNHCTTHEVPVNPDGQEAAARIEALEAAIKEALDDQEGDLDFVLWKLRAALGSRNI